MRTKMASSFRGRRRRRQPAQRRRGAMMCQLRMCLRHRRPVKENVNPLRRQRRVPQAQQKSDGDQLDCLAAHHRQQLTQSWKWYRKRRDRRSSRQCKSMKMRDLSWKCREYQKYENPRKLHSRSQIPPLLCETRKCVRIVDKAWVTGEVVLVCVGVERAHSSKAGLRMVRFLNH